MNKALLASVLALGGLIGLASSTHAHGGSYRGPGDTVPPAGGGSGGGGGTGPGGGPVGPTQPGSGPRDPGTSAPGIPAGAQGKGTPTPGSGDAGADLSDWPFWWEFNKDPYLNLKATVQAADRDRGVEGFFGPDHKTQVKDTYKPTEEQVRKTIVPALLAALEKETHNDIVTGCMVALAKIGDAPSETGESQFEKVIARFLSDKNQEIAETAAVSLGILANPKSIPTLEHLIRDTKAGRELVGQPEVNYRTRAFAAYGLGLIGAQASSEEDRQAIVKILREILESDDTKTRDLQVSCVISMGLVRLETLPTGAPRPAEKGVLVPPETSRVAELDYLLAFLQNEQQHWLVRAHCPTALARLLQGLPKELHDEYRQKIANDLLERIASKKQQAQMIQSAVLALGSIGTNDGADPLDKKIRDALIAAPKAVTDQQARNFSMIALAKIGGTPGTKDTDTGVKEAGAALLSQLVDGKSGIQPWAGLACGVMAERLLKAPTRNPMVGALASAVRNSLGEEKSPSKVGAFAISAGIIGDVEAKPMLMKHLDAEKDVLTRGYVAVGLGLMNAFEAKEKINAIVEESKYSPDLLKQAAIALGLLGDKDLVPKLVKLLAESKGLATQASISSALGFIGDKRSIDPLVAMLQNESLTEQARGFAAVALGIVADKGELPWNSRIGLDLNYQASTQTLTDQTSGTGILDIL